MTDDEIIKKAVERQKLAEDADRDNRTAAAEDMRFAIGDQWPAELVRQRDTEKRPALTINRVQQMVKQVVNDMRQNRPAIKVHPVDSGADVAVAEVLSGLIRHIEVDSNAPDAYDHAGECAVTGGFGYFRIITEYDGDGFDQCIKIKRIRNPFTVYYDPLATEADGSDARFAMVIDDMPADEFKRMYPSASKTGYETDNEYPEWVNDEVVRVAEYFTVEETEDTLYLMDDGTTVRLSELPAAPPSSKVVKTRKTTTNKVMWYKLTAVDVLEKSEWPGRYIPIIPVYGEEHDIEGEVIRFGLVRHAKDPQRIYNYSRTSAVEQVALAPKSPYVIAEGQVEGYEDIWATSNTATHAYLPYKPTTVAGAQVPMPQRQQFAGVPVGAISDMQLAAEEIKAVTGIYDASLGQRSNETSGIAIQRRDAQADNATFHFVDNLSRAIRYCGRQLVDMIPRIYDAPRQIRILGVDGAESIAAVNQPDPMTGQIINPLDVGRYDVTVDVGPSFQTRRIEAAQSMTEFVRAFPPAAQFAGDLIAKAMDWPDADEIAKRLRAAMPPGIVQDEESDVPPQLMAKLQEQQQVIQGLQQAMAESQAALQQAQEDKAVKIAELELKSREVGVKEAETQIKAGELHIKAQAQQLDETRLYIEANQPQAEPVETEGSMEQAPQPMPIVIHTPGNDALAASIGALCEQMAVNSNAMQCAIAVMQTVAVKPVRGPDNRLIGAVQVNADGNEVPIQIER